VTSLSLAQTQGWIDRDTATKVFAFSLLMIGYELDVDAIKMAVEKEEEKEGYEDYSEEQIAKSIEQRAKSKEQKVPGNGEGQ
jgi:hypothetical protein